MINSLYTTIDNKLKLENNNIDMLSNMNIQILTNYNNKLKSILYKITSNEIEIKKKPNPCKNYINVFNQNLKYFDKEIEYNEIVKKIKKEPMICTVKDCLYKIENNNLCIIHNKKICSNENCKNKVYKNNKCKIHKKKLCTIKRCGRILFNSNILCKIHNMDYINICIVRSCTNEKILNSQRCYKHHK